MSVDIFFITLTNAGHFRNSSNAPLTGKFVKNLVKFLNHTLTVLLHYLVRYKKAKISF